MSSLVKTQEEIKIMRDGGKLLAQIVDELEKQVVEESSSHEVNKYAELLCKRYNVKPAFLHYGARSNPFPGIICANLNEIVVHGVPSARKFKSGDIFGLDMGIIYYGMFLDMSVTILIGDVKDEVRKFVEKTRVSMVNGISFATPGNTNGDISFGMREGLIGAEFTLMKDFVGHGIGRNLHEKPEIPGEGLKKNEGMRLLSGMTLAIESISVMGPNNKYEIGKDQWTVYTKNKEFISGLWEHTVIVTENGPEVLTI